MNILVTGGAGYIGSHTVVERAELSGRKLQHCPNLHSRRRHESHSGVNLIEKKTVSYLVNANGSPAPGKRKRQP